QQPRGDPGAVDEQHVRRLHVAVDDPVRVRVREALEDLRGRLDRLLVVEPALAERVAKGAAGEVLVGDVDVPLVAGERVRAHAGGVPEVRGGGRLALGARAGGAGPRDDLQRDVAVALLVARVPDGAHPAAAERAQGPVADEHEPAAGRVSRSLRHPVNSFPARAETPSVAKDLATLARIETASGRGSTRRARPVQLLMTEHDTDLEFDFFGDEDPETRQAAQSEERPRTGGGGAPPRRPPPRRPPSARPPVGLTPLLRLAGLIAFAILIIVLFIFWISSCQGASKKSSYRSYMQKIGTVAKDSEQIGRELNDALTTQGIKSADLQGRISGLAQQEQQDVAAARSMSPPGPLRIQHQHAIEALEFRVSGLSGLADAFKQAALSPKNVTGNALLLAGQAERLVSGDVVWDDLFKDPSVDELRRQGVTGVAVPDSNFVPNPDYSSSRFWEAILQRLQGAATGGSTGTGLHGTGIVSTKALPGNDELSESSENTVTATTDLGFAVTVEDTGDSQEVQVQVTLTIQQSPTPIVQTKTIDLINPGEQKQVVFRNLGQVQFATRTIVKVDVKPVPQEKNTDNNSKQYPVIFSLG